MVNNNNKKNKKSKKNSSTLNAENDSCEDLLHSTPIKRSSDEDTCDMFTMSQMKEIMKMHEETILKVVNMTFERLDKKIDALRNDFIEGQLRTKEELEELKKSISFNEENGSEATLKTQEKVIMIEKEKTQYQKVMSEKFAEIEDRNRRNNLRFDNIEEEEKETWDVSESKVRKVFESIGVTKNVEIERAHRTGMKKSEKRRTIVVKFLNYKDREEILKKYIEKKLWNEHTYINEDYSEYTVNIRKELFKKAKERRNKGEYAKVVYNRLITDKRDV